MTAKIRKLQTQKKIRKIYITTINIRRGNESLSWFQKLKKKNIECSPIDVAEYLRLVWQIFGNVVSCSPVACAVGSLEASTIHTHKQMRVRFLFSLFSIFCWVKRVCKTVKRTDLLMRSCKIVIIRRRVVGNGKERGKKGGKMTC